MNVRILNNNLNPTKPTTVLSTTIVSLLSKVDALHDIFQNNSCTRIITILIQDRKWVCYRCATTRWKIV